MNFLTSASNCVLPYMKHKQKKFKNRLLIERIEKRKKEKSVYTCKNHEPLKTRKRATNQIVAKSEELNACIHFASMVLLIIFSFPLISASIQWKGINLKHNKNPLNIVN